MGVLLIGKRFPQFIGALIGCFIGSFSGRVLFDYILWRKVGKGYFEHQFDEIRDFIPDDSQENRKDD